MNPIPYEVVPLPPLIPVGEATELGPLEGPALWQQLTGEHLDD